MGIFFRLLQVVFVFYTLGLLVYALLTWFGGNVETNAWRRKLAPAYEPLLRPVRSIIKPTKVGDQTVDFSPVVLLVVLWLVVSSLVFIISGRTF